MELTREQKIEKLKRAAELLHEVNCLQQEVIEGDVCYENHNRLESMIEDFEADIEELEAETTRHNAASAAYLEVQVKVRELQDAVIKLNHIYTTKAVGLVEWCDHMDEVMSDLAEEMYAE